MTMTTTFFNDHSMDEEVIEKDEGHSHDTNSDQVILTALLSQIVPMVYSLTTQTTSASA